jgi:hypothetical protein
MLVHPSAFNDLYSLAKQHQYSPEEGFRINSVYTTRSSTPDGRSHEKYCALEIDDRHSEEEYKSSSNNSFRDGDGTPKRHSDEESLRAGFEIDVCPKKKKFTTPEERKLFIEEYRRKYKTELCKNYELRGCCKFGDKCSFAHGRHELQNKTALHTKYKTKPCKQYHQIGYCPYGQRCQYLHKEALKPNIFFVPTEEALTSDFKCYTYELLQEINKMCNNNEEIEKILEKLPKRPRLRVFQELTNGV